MPDRGPPFLVAAPSAGAKKTSGHIDILLIGDSIARGNGQDPSTGTSPPDGTDGLHYGGVALPAGARLFENGTELFVFPDDSGVGAGANGDPGHLPHIFEAFLAQGFTSVTIYRWASNGASIAVTRDTHFQNAWIWFKVNGVVPDLMLTCVGTNNSIDESSSDLFLAQCTDLDELAETLYPRLRIGHYHPTGDSSLARPQLDVIRGHISTIVAAKPTRFEMPRDGLDISIGGTGDMADDVHPSLYGYRDQTDLHLIAAWEAAS